MTELQNAVPCPRDGTGFLYRLQKRVAFAADMGGAWFARAAQSGCDLFDFLRPRIDPAVIPETYGKSGRALLQRLFQKSAHGGGLGS